MNDLDSALFFTFHLSCTCLNFELQKTKVTQQNH